MRLIDDSIMELLLLMAQHTHRVSNIQHCCTSTPAHCALALLGGSAACTDRRVTCGKHRAERPGLSRRGPKLAL